MRLRSALSAVRGIGAFRPRGPRRQPWLVVVVALAMALGGLSSLSTASAQSTTLYVSQSGSGTANCQTPQTACDTITRALSMAHPGYTIEVSGTIHDNVTVPASLSPIVISGAKAPSGSPAVVEGVNPAVPVFTIEPGTTVEMDHLTITNGGGPTSTGGGIYNHAGHLTLAYCRVVGNHASHGAGIDNQGEGSSEASLTVTDSTISGNEAASEAGGIYNNVGTVTVARSEVSDNKAIKSNAGGIENDSGHLTVIRTKISGNTALVNGGGIYSQGSGSVTVTESTISGNTAGYAGGGIYSETPLTVTYSTISGNTSRYGPGYGGGGIYSWGTATVTTSTLSGNKATDGGGIFVGNGTVTVTASTIAANTASRGGGIFNDAVNTVRAGATIVADNSADNCANSSGTIGNGFESVGYNLTDDTTRDACGFAQGTDIVDANPQLGQLAPNGGPTETMLPSLSSPAADKIPVGTTLNGVHVCGDKARDQRLVPRPIPHAITAKCTIGAVEVAPLRANVRITKSGPGTVTEGGTVTYTLRVFNSGPGAADGVTVTDALSKELTGISVSPSSRCTVTSGRTVNCDFGTLAAKTGRTITVTAHVAPGVGHGTNIENCGTVASTTPQVSEEDKGSCIATTVTPSPVPPGRVTDVAVTKIGPASAGPGQQITYTLTVTNLSRVTARNVVVNDVFPVEVTVTGVPAGCVLTWRTLSCAMGRLRPGGTRTFTVFATVRQVPAGSAIGNCGTVYTTTAETNLANNFSCVQTLVSREEVVPVTG